MAIPPWLDPGHPEAAAKSTATEGLPDALDVDGATGTFRLLSDATRVEVLVSLYERPTPVSYTDLRRSVSVDDNGRLNYHLRQLDGFVEKGDEGYALTDRGDALVEQVLAARRAVRD